MNQHYYSQEPTSEHQEETWHFDLLGETFLFTTDNGVFSKKTVDFGSRVLLNHFSEDSLPEGPILDVGCGYGAIGLPIAKVTNRMVEMVDINQRAVELAKKNAQSNHIENVQIHQSNLYEDLDLKKYAAIVSNPPIRAGKKVVHEILEKAYDLLLDEGTLTVVIQKKQGAPSAEKKMLEVFGNAAIVAKEKGYYILVSYKEKSKP